jgi:serine/threonine protein kinase
MLQFGGKQNKSSSPDSKRHFTVVMGDKEHGLYVSSTPSSAAKKAVTKLCAANKSKKVEFHIREITQGSKKKTYGPYEGYIEKLKEPIELKGRVIKYKPVAKFSKKKREMRGGGYNARLYVNKNIYQILDSSIYDNDNTLEFTIQNTETGEIIRYVNIRYLGKGGYGKVFLVENDKGEKYVIKITKNHINYFLKESTILDGFMNKINGKCQYKAVSQGQSIINGTNIGHIIFQYKGASDLFNITRKNTNKIENIISIPKILRDVLFCLIDINKYACHGDIKLENIVYDEITNTGFIIDFGFTTNFPITIKLLFEMNIGNEQISIDIIIVHLINKFMRDSIQKLDLYRDYLDDIQITIDNFGLFWAIIQCMTNPFFFNEYVSDNSYLNRSENPKLFNVYLNNYFNLDNSPPTPLRKELEKLFDYRIIPNFREQFITKVFENMSKTKYEVYFKNNKDLFNAFIDNILDLIRVDPKTRKPKQILLEDPFFSLFGPKNNSQPGPPPQHLLNASLGPKNNSQPGPPPQHLLNASLRPKNNSQPGPPPQHLLNASLGPKNNSPP